MYYLQYLAHLKIDLSLKLSLLSISEKLETASFQPKVERLSLWKL